MGVIIGIQTLGIAETILAIIILVFWSIFKFPVEFKQGIRKLEATLQFNNSIKKLSEAGSENLN